MPSLKRVHITQIHQGVIYGRVEVTFFHRSFALALDLSAGHRLRIRFLRSPLPLHAVLWRLLRGRLPPGITIVGEHMEVDLTVILQHLPLPQAGTGEDKLMVQTFFTQLLANGFADLKGLDITFCIPLPQALLNALLTEMLRPDATPRAAVSTPSPNGATPPRVDARGFLGLVKSAVLKLEKDMIIFEGQLQR